MLISFRNPGLLVTSGTAMVRATARCHLHLHPFPDPHPYPFLSIIILILIQSIIILTIILAQALEGGVIREEALEAASNQGQAAVDAQFLGISQVGLGSFVVLKKMQEQEQEMVKSRLLKTKKEDTLAAFTFCLAD